MFDVSIKPGARQVPSTCWFTNVRSCVSPKDWERLRRMIQRRAGMRCELCGATQDKQTRRWLEAHERWVFDPVQGVQRLARLICLCTDCHTVTHFGFAQVRGLEDAAFVHLMAVTGMDYAQAQLHVRGAFELWSVRSERTWDLDLSMLTNTGFTVQRPPQATERPAAVQAAFAAQDDGIRQRANERAKADGIRQRALAQQGATTMTATSPRSQEAPRPMDETIRPIESARTESWFARLVARLCRA